MDKQEIACRVKEAVEKHARTAKTLSDDLCANPELSGQEFESSRKMVSILKKAGYTVEYPFRGLSTAFRAILDAGRGPKAAILAEYDALPEVGHGCGHNLHGALSVLAALALAELKDLINGTVCVIGTPDEETAGAKILMAEKGVFDGLDLAVMMHSCGGGGFSQANMAALSLRGYVVEFSGQTAHAVAAPWRGRSALAAARKFIDLIDARRECFTPDAYVNAVISGGGSAANVIPGRASVSLEFRAASMGNLALMDDIISKCARGAALAMDCGVELRRSCDDFADMIRIATLEEEIEALFQSLGLPVKSVSPPLGSTDVGNVSYRCPSVQPLISITREDFALHTREFAEATLKAEAFDAMEKGAQALALLVLKTLRDEEFRKKTRDEFKANRAAKVKSL
ncbi:MAG: amidohydrolase [Treponema sp.]|jgi:amidohydrolase|nr:amidohydrolase [Treponema sp.]